MKKKLQEILDAGYEVRIRQINQTGIDLFDVDVWKKDRVSGKYYMESGCRDGTIEKALDLLHGWIIPPKPQAPSSGWGKKIWGKWPGDETDEEIRQALEDMG